MKKMARFHKLGVQQYEGGLSAAEKVEYDLLSALVTHRDRVDNGLLTMEATRASTQRIYRLEKQLDDLKGTPS